MWSMRIFDSLSWVPGGDGQIGGEDPDEGATFADEPHQTEQESRRHNRKQRENLPGMRRGVLLRRILRGRSLRLLREGDDRHPAAEDQGVRRHRGYHREHGPQEEAEKNEEEEGQEQEQNVQKVRPALGQRQGEEIDERSRD